LSIFLIRTEHLDQELQRF